MTKCVFSSMREMLPRIFLLSVKMRRTLCLLLACASLFCGAMGACNVSLFTPQYSLGPFFVPGAPESDVICSADRMMPYNQLIFNGTVTVCSCDPIRVCARVPRAKIQLWQADLTGEYTPQCRRTIRTDNQGIFRILTSKPGRYLYHGSELPIHIHFLVSSDEVIYLPGVGRVEVADHVGQLNFENDYLLDIERPPSATIRKNPQLKFKPICPSERIYNGSLEFINYNFVVYVKGQQVKDWNGFGTNEDETSTLYGSLGVLGNPDTEDTNVNVQVNEKQNDKGECSSDLLNMLDSLHKALLQREKKLMYPGRGRSYRPATEVDENSKLDEVVWDNFRKWWTEEIYNSSIFRKERWGVSGESSRRYQRFDHGVFWRRFSTSFSKPDPRTFWKTISFINNLVEFVQLSQENERQFDKVYVMDEKNPQLYNHFGYESFTERPMDAPEQWKVQTTCLLSLIYNQCFISQNLTITPDCFIERTW